MNLDISLVQVDPSWFTKKRKLNTTACVRCHERKVKCDAGSQRGGSCKNCDIAGEICRTHLDGRVRGADGVQPRRGALTVTTTHDQVSDSRDTPYQVGNSSGPSTTSSSAPKSAAASPYTAYAAPDQPSPSEDSSVPYLPNDMALEALERDDTHLSQLPTHPNAPLSMQHVMRTREPASLERFEAYFGDILGPYAPSFREPSEREVLTEAGGYNDWSRLADARACHPINVDMSNRPTLDLEQQVATLDSADMEYLKTKGAFDLPPRKLQEDLIEAYFADVHPTAPVINRKEFLTAFYQHGNPSRLLLFAIFTSGSRACRNPALLDNKGTNQSSAQRFYKATKALLDTGYEQSRLVRVQALLLLTWWWDKKDDGGRNMRSCAVDAINTAQSMGMHRWDHYPQADIVQVRSWKRIWWTCFQRDVAVAVSHGLPCILSLSDFDVQPLCAADFIEEIGVPLELHRYPYSSTEVAFSIEMVKAAEILHHIQRDQFVRQRLHHHMTGSIAGREASVENQSAPPGFKARRVGCADDFNDEGLRLCRELIAKIPDIVKYDVDDVQQHSFWPSFLHILYYTNVMLRFRDKAVSRPANGRAEAERQYCQARGIAAATMVSKTMRNVRAYGHLLRFTGQLTVTLYNCLIFFLIEAQSSNIEVRRDAQSKYSLCLNMLFEFSQLWISASLVHRLFEALQAHMQISNKQPSSSFGDQWHNLLPGLRTSSDITNSYMEQLLATDFHYEGSSLAGLSFGQSTTSFGTGHSPATQYFLEDTSQPSPDFELPLGVGSADSLNVEQWVNYFGLGDDLSDPSQCLQPDGIGILMNQG